MSKMEVAILKQRFAHNHLPNAFEPLNIPELISLSTITNTDIRQNPSERYHKILQRTKSDMMCVYIAAEEHRIKFDKDMASMNASLRSSGPANRRITRAMVDLLLERFNNMEDRYSKIQNKLFTISLSRCSSQSIYGTTGLSRSRTYLCITESTTLSTMLLVIGLYTVVHRISIIVRKVTNWIDSTALMSRRASSTTYSR